MIKLMHMYTQIISCIRLPEIVQQKCNNKNAVKNKRKKKHIEYKVAFVRIKFSGLIMYMRNIKSVRFLC